MNFIINLCKAISKWCRSFEKLVLHSFWTALFILFCYFLYERGLGKRNHDFSKLQSKYLEMQEEKKSLLAQKNNLLLQINSQSDPEWVELVLMKELGLVPEGQTKVLFGPP